jgi:hypothetical protein
MIHAFRDALLMMRLAQVRLAIQWSLRAIDKGRDDLAAGLVAQADLMARLRIREHTGEVEIQPNVYPVRRQNGTRS